MRKTLEQFKKEVLALKGKEYTVLGEYETNKTPIIIRHEKCGYDWSVRPGDILKGRNCPRCSNIRKAKNKTLSDEVYRRRISDTTDDFVQLTDYKGAGNKITFKHKECGRVFNVNASDFEKRRTCSLCGKEKTGWGRRLTQREFVSSLPDSVLEEYTLLTEYVNSRTLIKTRKKTCGHVNLFIPHDLRNSNDSCALCSSSKGERKIRLLLERSEVTFKEQFTFSDCVSKRALPFDFAVFNKKKELELIIEFDGEQHFRNVNSWGGIESYRSTRKNDMIKNQYCRRNGIRLIRIRYDEFKELNKTIEMLLS